VLVPVKRLDGAKSRLAAVLSARERAELMRELLGRVLAAAGEAGVGPVTVVSSEPLALDGVTRFDDRGLAWNEAIAAAMRGVTAPVAAVVSADLPDLVAEDVRALVESVPSPRGLAIARALDGGTNAVAMRPPGAVRTCFGLPGSAAEHVRLARGAGLEWRTLDRPGLAFDVDTPQDLERLSGGAGLALGRSRAWR